MVLKKRLDYGFEGFRVPVIPRAPRSLRRRAFHKKSVEDSQICAIELLAAVAGKLLQDSESSSSSNVAEGKEQIDIHKDDIKQEQVEDKAAKSDILDQGSCIESESLKELPHSENENVLGHTSIITGSGSSNEIGTNPKLEDGVKRQLETVREDTGNLSVYNTRGSKDLTGLRVNSHVLINSDSSVMLPLFKAPVPNAYFPGRRNTVNICTRDDDENSFRCNQLNFRRNPFRQQSSMRYRRIRKMLSSRYWKAAAPKFRDYKLSNPGREMKPFYRNRKRIYTQERCQLETSYKRRKMFEHRSSAISYDPEGSSGSISNSPEKGGKGDKSRSAASLRRASGITSPSVHHKSPFQSKDRHVKFSIKSFGVPELYIEVPENVTVGSLKRKVMEAVTALLGDELRVGLLLQGKKIRDDNRTLQQSGISQSSELDNLGFTLESTTTVSQASSPVSHKDSPFLQSCNSLKHSPRSPASPNLDSGVSDPSGPLATKLDNPVETNQEIVPSSIDLPIEETTMPDSKALVAIPPLNVEALSVIPMNQKSKRSELSQRRTRRPFSVSEVESLVEAVEKLGTGRWRDVKMRAFDDANHRTYVDLKDKWKTLVHTASIAPQQRRGQPVPQELLDRVLAAHSHWSQHQSKQHGKNLIESYNKNGAEIIGV